MSLDWLHGKDQLSTPKGQSTKLVRDAVLSDNTGSIPLSIWEEHISTIQEGRFYTLTDCRLQYYYGKCLSTTETAAVSEAEKQDVDTQQEKKVVSWVCCPEILNVGVNIFLACNTKDCRKKINNTPGSKIVKCHSCGRSMLVKIAFWK